MDAVDPDLHARLADLYARLEDALARRAPALPGDNPCGACFQCCTASGRRGHGVTELELAYLAQGGGADRLDDFRAYTAAATDADGHLRFPVCPYYDVGRHACTVYEVRPFSCRVFGHFRVEGSRLPADCVFEGTEEAFPRAHYAARVPLARELVELDWEHLSRSGHAADTPVTPEGEPPAPGTVERAVFHMLRGESPEAHAAFAQAAPSAWLHYSWGTLHTREGDHAKAAEHYAEALRIEPRNPLYALQQGIALLQSGRVEDAYAALEQSVALRPSGEHAHALLGHLDLAMGRPASAVQRFEAALRLIPDDPALQTALSEARRRAT